MVVRHAVKEQEGRSLGNIMVSRAWQQPPLAALLLPLCAQALLGRQPEAELLALEPPSCMQHAPALPTH
jgi:hypothetical protein